MLACLLVLIAIQEQLTQLPVEIAIFGTAALAIRERFMNAGCVQKLQILERPQVLDSLLPTNEIFIPALSVTCDWQRYVPPSLPIQLYIPIPLLPRNVA